MSVKNLEIHKHFDKLYEEYRYSTERKVNLERQPKITAKDLARRFTI